jgi:undecaprenyl-diphosphatase
MDRHLLFLLNQQWTHPFLDRVLGTLSSLDFWLPFMAAGACALVWKQRHRGAACVLICALGVFLSESCIARPLKKLTQRARPHQSMEGVRRVEVAGARPRVFSLARPMQVSRSGPPEPKGTLRGSFPSAHVLNSTLLGIVLWTFLRWPGWLLLPPLMAWSRVYTGAHWPSDVLASLLLGVPFSLLLLRACESIWRGPLTRLRPAWTADHPTLVFPLSNPSDLMHHSETNRGDRLRS